jgi:hypothetical protein
MVLTMVLMMAYHLRRIDDLLPSLTTTKRIRQSVRMNDTKFVVNQHKQHATLIGSTVGRLQSK